MNGQFILGHVDTVRRIALSMFRYALGRRRDAVQNQWDWGRGYYSGMADAYGSMLKSLRSTRKRIVYGR